ARLPRGRDHRDRGEGAPAPRRGAGHHARARGRPFVHHRGPLRLLHGEGLARPLRRALPRAEDLVVTPFKVSLVAALVSFGLLAVVLDLSRSRRLRERYALLWLVTAGVMIVLSLWRSGLDTLAGMVGIAYAPSALFAVAAVFIVVVLLHYSTVISRLSDENAILAQRLA